MNRRGFLKSMLAAGVASAFPLKALASKPDVIPPLTTAFCDGLIASGGLDTGAIANRWWYHVFRIEATDGTKDYLFSMSADHPALPDGWKKDLRIGSFQTNGSGWTRPFTQIGDRFKWDAPVVEYGVMTRGWSCNG